MNVRLFISITSSARAMSDGGTVSPIMEAEDHPHRRSIETPGAGEIARSGRRRRLRRRKVGGRNSLI